MKFIITESQLRLLIIEDDDKPGYSWASSQPSTQTSTKAETNLPTVTTYTKTIAGNPIEWCFKNKISGQNCWKEFCKTLPNDCKNLQIKMTPEQIKEVSEIIHWTLTGIAIATAFMGPYGALISAGVQLMDASLYAVEGDWFNAGLTGGMSLIPVAGPVLGKVPALSKLGQKGYMAMMSKLARQGPKAKLDPNEFQALKYIGQNQDFVMQQTNQNVKLLSSQAANTAKNTKTKETLKKIGKFGIQGGKEFVKDEAIGMAYTGVYNQIQSDTPKAIAEKMGLNWEQVKTTFGSENTAEDNIKLKMALQNGWTPGNVVPVQYRTKKYNQQFSQALTSDEESDRARREYLLNRK